MGSSSVATHCRSSSKTCALSKAVTALVIIAVAATPYSYAFASSFTSAVGKTTRDSPTFSVSKKRPSQLVCAPHQRILSRWTGTRFSSTTVTTSTSIAAEGGEKSDPMNDHGGDDSLKQSEISLRGGSVGISISSGSSDSSSTTAPALLPATPPPLPTSRQYLKFALPCLGLWIAGPLLSLVDTAFVGLSSKEGVSSAQQLAALGPATT